MVGREAGAKPQTAVRQGHPCTVDSVQAQSRQPECAVYRAPCKAHVPRGGCGGNTSRMLLGLGQPEWLRSCDCLGREECREIPLISAGQGVEI